SVMDMDLGGPLDTVYKSTPCTSRLRELSYNAITLGCRGLLSSLDGCVSPTSNAEEADRESTDRRTGASADAAPGNRGAGAAVGRVAGPADRGGRPRRLHHAAGLRDPRRRRRV